MTRNWKRWTIPRAFHPGAEYEKEVEQSASFKEDIPLSACCLTVLSLYGVNRNDPLPISKKKEEVPIMRAAKMKERPTFQLMCQTDVQSIYHMQMPRWLFSDPRYCEMSLDAKVTYTFLLNRFQLSRKNGWVNDRGEVFVIFPRKALAKELRICEQRVTAAFKKLVELKLVWEKRCGRGDANQIYLARVTPIEDPDYSCAPFITEDESEVRGSRTSDLEGLADGKPSAACQEPQNLLSKNREDRASRTAKSAFPEPQKLTPSKKEKRKIDQSHREVRQSVRAPVQDGRTDGDAEEELLDILDGCELECFAPETALVFENAIERLFYSKGDFTVCIYIKKLRAWILEYRPHMLGHFIHGIILYIFTVNIGCAGDFSRIKVWNQAIYKTGQCGFSTATSPTQQHTLTFVDC